MRLTVVRAVGVGRGESAFFPSNLYYITKLCLSQQEVVFLVIGDEQGVGSGSLRNWRCRSAYVTREKVKRNAKRNGLSP